MALDTRANALRLLGKFDRTTSVAIMKTACSALIALLVVFTPSLLGWNTYDGLTDAGKATLGILVFGALMWVIEAIPSFAVALLIMGLEVAILGKPGGVFTEVGDTKGWQIFVAPWASSIMWLFLGGFVLAQACSQTGLDRWIAGIIIGKKEKKPAQLMLGVMVVTFILSMFMSNTATATMMLAVMGPVVLSLPEGSKLGKSLCLAVPIAANVGGMGTIIGTPPNAIAAGQLGDKMDFLKWMYLALPPAIMIMLVAYGVLLLGLKGTQQGKIKLEIDQGAKKTGNDKLKQIITMGVFAVTVLLWMTSSLHNTPSSVISFLPIVVLATTGVVSAKDMRKLPWDVLILLAGGLSLGVALKQTGLAAWFATLIPTSWTGLPLVIAFALLAVILSNLMSNTATANIMIPIVLALAAPGSEIFAALVIALTCSSAMCLPISTPPNAVAYASGRVATGDFMKMGLIMAVVGPLISVLWCWMVLKG